MAQTPAQVARTAANDAREAADFVAEEASKVEAIKAGYPVDEPIPSYYEWVKDEEITSIESSANAAAEEAERAAAEAEEAEAAGNLAKAAEAAARAEAAHGQAEKAADEAEEVVETAKTDEDNLGGPLDDEVSDPENVFGVRDD